MRMCKKMWALKSLTNCSVRKHRSSSQGNTGFGWLLRRELDATLEHLQLRGLKRSKTVLSEV